MTALASGMWCRQHTEGNCLGKCLGSVQLAMGMTPSFPPSPEAVCLAGAVPGIVQSGSSSLPTSSTGESDQLSLTAGTASYSPLYLPEVVPRRDRLFCKLVIQPAKRIVRITFRRGFIKITVPFNLNSYHTTLDEKKRQCEFFKLSSTSLSSTLSDPTASSPREQEQMHF